MSGTDDMAAALHRLTTQHPDWRIVRVDGPDWTGWAALRGEPGSPGEEAVTAPTLLQLEVKLAGL